jgi:hypothetical protein
MRSDEVSEGVNACDAGREGELSLEGLVDWLEGSMPNRKKMASAIAGSSSDTASG